MMAPNQTTFIDTNKKLHKWFVHFQNLALLGTE